MTSSFIDLLMQLPSVQKFVRDIVDDIIGNRSVVVFVPLTIDPSWLWAVLVPELWRRSFDFRPVESTAVVSTNQAAAALSEALRVAWPSSSVSRNIASLLTIDDLPDVILLNGIESLNPTAQNAWLGLVTQWAQVSQNLPSRSVHSPVLCTILQPASLATKSMDSNVRLAIHWWWGFPSILELRLLCRLAGAGQLQDELRVRWQEHLLPEIVGTDIVLLEKLWNDDTGDINQLVAWVEKLAPEKGWTRENLRQWGELSVARSRVRRSVPTSETPPGTLRDLWAQGALHLTQERGVELHPAALTVLGRGNELQHRLWRGQAELLLPTLDGIRLDLCSHLTRLYGKDWPIKWHRPEHLDEEAAVRETPLACGWGYLEWLIRNVAELQRERRWLPLVIPALSIRNTISHYRTVSRTEYERVLEQYQRFLEATCC